VKVSDCVEFVVLGEKINRVLVMESNPGCLRKRTSEQNRMSSSESCDNSIVDFDSRLNHLNANQKKFDFVDVSVLFCSFLT
jgi:hypothetical protein